MDYFLSFTTVTLIGLVAFGLIYAFKLIRKLDQNKEVDAGNKIVFIVSYIAEQIPAILTKLKAIDNAPTTKDQVEILVSKVYDELIIILEETSKEGYSVSKNILVFFDMFGKEKCLEIINSLVSAALNKLMINKIVSEGLDSLTTSQMVFIGAGRRHTDEPHTLQ